MAGVMTLRLNAYGAGAAPPGGTERQFLAMGDEPVYVNTSDTADRQYLTLTAYVNEED